MDNVLLGIVLQRLKESPLEEQATNLLLGAFESEERLSALGTPRWPSRSSRPLQATGWPRPLGRPCRRTRWRWCRAAGRTGPVDREVALRVRIVVCVHDRDRLPIPGCSHGQRQVVGGPRAGRPVPDRVTLRATRCAWQLRCGPARGTGHSSARLARSKRAAPRGQRMAPCVGSRVDFGNSEVLAIPRAATRTVRPGGMALRGRAKGGSGADEDCRRPPVP
jgi:hypothetical protein